MNRIKLAINFILLIFFCSAFTGFLIEEKIVPIAPSLLNLFQDFLLILTAILCIKVTRSNKRLYLHICLFLIITVFSNLVNSDFSVIVFLNGLREFLPYFLFPLIYFSILQSSYRQVLINKFNKFLKWFLAIQIPVTLYQYSIHGAGDFVGGTFGFGFSGILSSLIFLSTFYLLSQNYDPNKRLTSLKNNSYLFIFWIPIFINETKISTVLMVVFFLLLSDFSLRYFWKNMIMILGVLMLITFFQQLYTTSTGQDYFEHILNKEYLERYFISDDERFHETDVPRVQKFVLIYGIFDDFEFFFGKGIGHFKGGSITDLTPFASKFDWLLRGSRPMLFFLFVQVGIIGAITFVSFWILLVVHGKRKESVPMDSRLISYTSFIFLVIQLYNDSFRFIFFNGIIMFILLYAVVPVFGNKSKGFSLENNSL